MKENIPPSPDLCLPLFCNSVALMVPTFTRQILAIMWQIFTLSIHKPILRLQQYIHYFTFILEVKHYQTTLCRNYTEITEDIAKVRRYIQSV